MEKTVSTPFWTGMTLFSIDRKATHRRQKHNLLDTIYEGRGRVLFKGQLFSAPMDWPGILEQLERAAQEEALVALPVQGAVLAAPAASEEGREITKKAARDPQMRLFEHQQLMDSRVCWTLGLWRRLESLHFYRVGSLEAS